MAKVSVGVFTLTPPNIFGLFLNKSPYFFPNQPINKKLKNPKIQEIPYDTFICRENPTKLKPNDLWKRPKLVTVLFSLRKTDERWTNTVTKKLINQSIKFMALFHTTTKIFWFFFLKRIYWRPDFAINQLDSKNLELPRHFFLDFDNFRQPCFRLKWTNRGVWCSML